MRDAVIVVAVREGGRRLTGGVSDSRARLLRIGAGRPANETERAGAKVLLKPLLEWFLWLRKIWVDSGYSGPDFAAWVREQRPKLETEVIKRSDDLTGFHILPKRWIIERTFAWLVQNRRLARDYEQTESRATGLIYVAMIRLMLRRLA